MIKVETPYHIITSNSDSLPKYACKGKCKSVWWEGESWLEGKTLFDILNCPKCGGPIREATENDYSIISRANNVTQFQGQLIIENKHEVKPEFEEMAKREWC